LTPTDIVQAALVVVLTENRIITPTKVNDSPEHVIEILSPLTASNDRTLKRALYERAGVTEYWILDPFEQVITQLVMLEGTYKEQSHQGKVAVSYLPEVVVDLSRVW
jgi:Uma2 family endonuclease